MFARSACSFSMDDIYDRDEISRLLEEDGLVDGFDPEVLAMEEAAATKHVLHDWWADKTDDEKVTELLDLYDFVVRYAADHLVQEKEIPPCWYRHEGMIHVLFAIKNLRENHYDEDISQGSLSGPFNFYYGVPGLSQQLRNLVIITGCNSREHFPDEEHTAMWVLPGSLQRSAAKTEFEENLAERFQTNVQELKKEREN